MRFNKSRLIGAGLALLACVVPALAATLAGTMATAWNMTYRGTNDLGSPSFSLNLALQPSTTFTSGTGNNQGNALFSDTRSLGASGTENLDLAGVLVDPLGTTLTFLTVKAIKITADPGNTGNVQVGGAASNTFIGMFGDPTDIINVKPGGTFVWIAPQTGASVTAATGDILKIVNSSSTTSVNYSVFIIGTQ
jgi:hypothetical protein